MAKLPTFSSNLFTWNKGAGRSTITTLGVFNFPPRGFYIRSERTRELKLFLPNNESAEQLDGEAYDYFVPGGGIEARIYVGDAL